MKGVRSGLPNRHAIRSCPPMKNHRRHLLSRSHNLKAGVGLASFALAAVAASPQSGTDTLTTTETVALPEVVITGRSDSLIEIAGSANEGVVGTEQLLRRPLFRSGEVLETVPGLIVTQHSGGGKANQYFLRGFNLDHGTDLAVGFEGMPFNQRTHGHGQGYIDLNPLMPELLRTVGFRKGPYYAEVGDFGTAGQVDLSYVNFLEQGMVKLEGGMFDYQRAFLADSVTLGDGQLLLGGEYLRDNGPWVNDNNLHKVNAVARYSRGDDALGYSLTAMGYWSDWDATDQIPERAVRTGLVDRLGTIDPTAGGKSYRLSLNGEWHCEGDNSSTRAAAYAVYSDLDLFSNFTFFESDPASGDQFHQEDKRTTVGFDLSHTIYGTWAERETENTFGLQSRTDDIDNGLFNTAARSRIGTVRSDDVVEFSISPYYRNETRWTDKFRTIAGVRGDLYHFDVENDNAVNSGTTSDFIASPKLSLVFGPWRETELYVNGGFGFHSNDGRGTTLRDDPSTAAVNDGVAVDPLVRQIGSEIGVRTLGIAGLQSSLSFWFLDSDSELLFVGDAGNTEATGSTERFGIEFANYYRINEQLTLDFDLAWSHARFKATPAGAVGNHVPNSLETVINTGISLDNLGNWHGALRARYFGPGPLNEANTVRSRPALRMELSAGYRFAKNWDLTVTAFNLLNRKDHDISYFYSSRLATDPVGPGTEDRHFHPVEPFGIRAALTGRF